MTLSRKAAVCGGNIPSISCLFCSRHSDGARRRLGAAKFSSRAATDGRQRSNGSGPEEEAAPRRNPPAPASDKPGPEPKPEPEPGPMTRRLEDATEEALRSGGASGRRVVEEAGFSDELKQRLLDKMAEAEFREKHPAALAEAGLPAAAGEGTRRMAAAQPWTGSEAVEDAVLRMLDDSRRPLKPEMRGQYRPPPAAGPPVVRPPRKGRLQSPGQRVSSARDQAASYADTVGAAPKGLRPEEREEMKKQFRERFQPEARSMPVSVSGMAALANERIADAMARGQFKDLPRGKPVEADPRAASPFIDTTEYLMNRMIKRQSIVPPWIEKQQELVQAADVFRRRLRNDWKRHAARMVAARGGSLQEQMRRAEDYAAAERTHNPRPRGAEETTPVPTSSTDDPVATAQLRQPEAGQAEGKASSGGGRLFRDGDWERAESAYLRLSIEQLNAMTRSYNLMAPEVARKPYFSLQRELAACFADVAPQLAGEIKQRAAAPGGGQSATAAAATERGGGIVDRLGGGEGVRIHVEAEEKAYGLREWWRDFWKRW